MTIHSKIFGTIEIEDSKIIHFEKGIIGFPDMKDYTLLFDSEEEDQKSVHWLQSVEEATLAIPVIDPTLIREDYNPVVEDELLEPLGELEDGDILILTSMTVPAQIEKMTVNMKAPFIINVKSQKACQIILEGSYEIKFPVYELLKSKQAKDGE